MSPKPKKLSPLSQKSINWDMSQFMLRYGSWNVKEIQVDHIASFLKSYKKQGKAPASVNRMKSTLKRFFTYLLEADHIKKMPFTALKHEKIVRKSVTPLKPEMRLALQNIASSKKNIFLLLHLYLGLGLRLSEALELNVSDVENQKVLRIVGKGKKVRHLNIKKSLRNAIDAWLTIRTPRLSNILSSKMKKRLRTKINKDALFLTLRGTRLSSVHAQNLFRDCFRKAGLKNFTIHKLRHAFATNLVKTGTHIRTVQEILGHAHINTTQIYTTVTREDVDQALSRAEEANF